VSTQAPGIEWDEVSTVHRGWSDVGRSVDPLHSVVEFLRTYGAIDLNSKFDWPCWDAPSPRSGPTNEKAARRRGDCTEEYAVVLHVAQCLAKHWIQYRDEQPTLSAWASWECEPHIDAEWQAWDGFEFYLNLGLQTSAPRIVYQEISTEAGSGTDEDLTDRELQLSRQWSGGIEPDLFDALCVQLFQTIVDHLDVLTCANETCGRRFTKQRGTAQAKQYHTRGVIYCSKSCAYTQASRNRRRKQRAKRAEG
jgi:hypothetical protein